MNNIQNNSEILNIDEIIQAVNKYPWPTDIAPIIKELAKKRRDDYVEIQKLKNIITTIENSNINNKTNNINYSENISWRDVPRSIPNITNKLTGSKRFEMIQIPSVSAGSIIGKNGCIIKNISNNSGAKIIIQDINSIKKYQKRRGIKIIGKNSQINKAKEIIAKLIGQDSIVERKCFCCGIVNCKLINNKK